MTLRHEPPGAVVIGGYVNGLGLVRALAARGVRTAVVRTKPFDIAHRSRHAVGSDEVAGLEEHPDRLVELLERRAGDWHGWALIPTNDESLAALALHHERLSSLYRVASPGREVARYLLDKGLLLDVARAVGAEVPRCYGPAVAATAELPELSFPVVVKPLAGYRFAARFGTKLFAADDRDELRSCIARLETAGIPGHVLDLVAGDDSRIYAHCTYVDARGEPLGGVTIRKLRQSPPLFGVARVAEIADGVPELREATVEILRRIGHRGIAVAEFKRDARDGSLRFIELNGRSVLYNGLLRRAGLDLGGLAWSDYAGGGAERVRPSGWSGVWVNLHADVLYSALYRSGDRVRVGEFLAPYRRRTIDAVWSATDPAPFLAQWSRTARECARGGRRRALADAARPGPMATAPLAAPAQRRDGPELPLPAPVDLAPAAGVDYGARL